MKLLTDEQKAFEMEITKSTFQWQDVLPLGHTVGEYCDCGEVQCLQKIK